MKKPVRPKIEPRVFELHDLRHVRGGGCGGSCGCSCCRPSSNKAADAFDGYIRS